MRRCGLAFLFVLPIACGPVPIVGESESESGSESESSSTDATTTETGADSCSTEFWIDPEVIPQDVMLVVDTSRSMATLWDHDDDPVTPEVTRWSSAHALIQQLVETDESPAIYELGVQRFPAAAACPGPSCTDADVCVVESVPEVSLASDSAPSILAALPSADASALVGGSPAGAAFVSARDALLASPPERPKFIVLITDGGANCSAGDSLPDSYELADEALLDAVDDAYAIDGILTFVVGVDALDSDAPAGEDTPAGNTFTVLDNLALAGGAPWLSDAQTRWFYDVRDAEALIFGLGGVYPSDPSCELDLTLLEAGPPDPAQIPFVTFELDGMEVPRVDDCASEDGWAWILEGEVMTFCGTPCALFESGAALHGVYGCEMP